MVFSYGSGQTTRAVVVNSEWHGAHLRNWQGGGGLVALISGGEKSEEHRSH